MDEKDLESSQSEEGEEVEKDRRVAVLQPADYSSRQVHRKPLPEEVNNNHLNASTYTTEYKEKEQHQQYAPPSTTMTATAFPHKDDVTNGSRDAPLPPLPTTNTDSSYTFSQQQQQQPSEKHIGTHARYNSSSTLLQRVKTRYNRLSKRSRYLLLAAVLAVIALIIGLGAGLGVTQSRASRFRKLPLPSAHGGPYTGDLTYYDPGLGACGVTSTSADFIVSVSHIIFDAVSTSSNPNANPLCGKKIRAQRAGKSVDLTVVDRCTGCQSQDLDVTRTVFAGLADIDQGRVQVTWAWLD